MLVVATVRKTESELVFFPTLTPTIIHLGMLGVEEELSASTLICKLTIAVKYVRWSEKNTTCLCDVVE